MPSTSDRTISILTTHIDEIVSLEKRKNEAVFPKLSGFVVRSSQLAIADLGEELSKTMKNLSAVLGKIDDAESKYYLDEIHLSLGIDASGKISLVGEVAAGVQTGVQIILKRRETHAL